MGPGRDGGDLRGAARVGVDRVHQRAALPGREDAHRHPRVAAGRSAGARGRDRPQRRVRDLTRREHVRHTRGPAVLGVLADLVTGDVEQAHAGEAGQPADAGTGVAQDELGGAGGPDEPPPAPAVSAVMVVGAPHRVSGRNVCSRPTSPGAKTRTNAESCRLDMVQVPWTVSSTALATWVGARVTTCPTGPWRVAGRPTGLPVSSASETPGKPVTVHVVVPALRRIRCVIWWPPPGEFPPICSARCAAVQRVTEVAAGAADAPGLVVVLRLGDGLADVDGWPPAAAGGGEPGGGWLDEGDDEQPAAASNATNASGSAVKARDTSGQFPANRDVKQALRVIGCQRFFSCVAACSVTTAAPAASYRPLAGYRTYVTVFLVMSFAALAVGIGFAVVALAGSHDPVTVEPRP